MTYVTADIIKTLREEKGYTQKQLAQRLCVSDKTISKWETNKGLPDITLIEPLAKELGVSVAELLRGQYTANMNKSGNMLRSNFYVCPVCGNVIFAMGGGEYSCCGISLPPSAAEAPDEAHCVKTETVENEVFITVNHPMNKEHYISFIAVKTFDRLQIVKLYPQQDCSVRFPMCKGKLYFYCNKHGLFTQKLQ